MPIRTTLLAAGLLAAGPAAAGALVSDLASDTRDLDAYTWKARPVLLFAPSPADPAYQEQVARLEAAEEALRERDIVVLSDTAPEKGGALRAGFAPDGFLMVLVGKDGGTKLRRDRPITTEELFATIDAMPMRRNGS